MNRGTMALALAAAGLLLVRQTMASTAQADALPEGDAQAPPVLDDVADLEAQAYAPDAYAVTMNDPDANVAAFLAAIRRFESEDSPRGYRMLYGGQLFTDTSKHPAAGTWKGAPLPDAMCRAAGFGPGCVSTAAGAYQFILPTWQNVARRLGLADFSPESQDRAAVQLLADAGALVPIQLGQFDTGLTRARRTWASMPAAGWGQAEASRASWATAYTTAGGNIA